MLKKRELMALPEVIGDAKGMVSAHAEIDLIKGAPILHIDVAMDGEVFVRYFADREADRWVVHGKKAGWSQMGLESAVNYELSGGFVESYDYYGHRLYQITGSIDFDFTKDMVVDYLETTKLRTAWWVDLTGVMRVIGDWELTCRSKKRNNAYMRKQNRINEIMAAVPDLPDDFNAFLDTLFNDFMYVKKEGDRTRYICTSCGKSGQRKMKARIGSRTACPRCGKDMMIRSLTKKYRPEKANVVLMQLANLPVDKKDKWMSVLLPEKHVYVLRQMTVYSRALVGEREYEIFEGIRAVIPRKEYWGDVYYGQYSDAPIDSQEFWTSNRCSWRWKSSYLYPGNLKEVLPAAGLQHSGLDILAEKREKINVNYFVVKYPGNRHMEYLIKAGLFNLVRDINDGHLEYVPKDAINTKGRNLQECLLLTGQEVNRLRQINGGNAALQWLRVESRTGRKVSQESLEFFTRNSVSPWDSIASELLKKLGSPNKLANYLRKQMELTGHAASTVLQTWKDYMDMCRRLKKQTDNEMIYKPKNVDAAHDACMALLKREDAKKRAEEIRRKFPEVEINLQVMTDKYEFADDQYMITVPQSLEDIIVEGATLGHCIDRTDVYFDRIQNRTSFLVFLRRAEHPDAPWYTLEIEPGGTIRQKRTVGNTQKDTDIKAFTPFLREWQKHVLRKMNESDRALAKASKEARLSEYADLRARKEPIRNGVLRGQLLADVLEADLMEAM